MEIYQVLSLFILSLCALSAMLPFIRFSSGFLRSAVRILVVVVSLLACFSFISKSCAPQPWTPSYNPTVYTTDTGSCYHNAGCGSLWISSHAKTLCEAILANYQRCLRCNPPKYSEEWKARILSSRESTAPALDEFLLSREYIVSSIFFTLLIIGYHHFELRKKLHSGDHRYMAAVLDHASVLFGIFYTPAIISVFMLLYTAFGTVMLVGIPLWGCIMWIAKFFASKKKPAAIPEKIIPSQSPNYPSSAPYSVNPAAQSVLPARNDAPSYRVCHFMWTRSIIFCEHIQEKPSLQCVTYIWTAFFYSIAKHMRNQDLVDEIYSQFKLSAEPFIKDGENKAMSLHYIQSTYWRFRSTLNASGIDPRTQDGISKLWKLTTQWAFPDVQLPKGAETNFSYNVQLLTNRALTLYGLKPPPETVYYLEAANGMTVRVPESKLEAWQAEQDKLRQGIKRERTPAEQKFIDDILTRIYGSKD